MSKPTFSKSHLWAAAMALGLLLGCQSHNAYGPGKDAGADGQKPLAGVVSYIRQHEQRMPYLQERNFSANDLVVSKADCSITGDTIYVKIPLRASTPRLAGHCRQPVFRPSPHLCLGTHHQGAFTARVAVYRTRPYTRLSQGQPHPYQIPGFLWRDELLQ